MRRIITLIFVMGIMLAGCIPTSVNPTVIRTATVQKTSTVPVKTRTPRPSPTHTSTHVPTPVDITFNDLCQTNVPIRIKGELYVPSWPQAVWREKVEGAWRYGVHLSTPFNQKKTPAAYVDFDVIVVWVKIAQGFADPKNAMGVLPQDFTDIDIRFWDSDGHMMRGNDNLVWVVGYAIPEVFPSSSDDGHPCELAILEIHSP